MDPGSDKITLTQTILLIILVYGFGVLCRMFYFWTALDVPSTLLNGVPMISTEDGYLFADHVKAHINQDFSIRKLSLLAGGGHGSITALTYFLVKILPWNLEQVAVFMPAMFAPLLAVPMVLTGRWLGNTTMGVFAALIAVVAMPYLKRTSFAYYDTDLFALTAPAMIVALGIYAIRNPGIIPVALTSLMACLTMWLDKVLIAGVMQVAIVIVFVITNFRNPVVYSRFILLCVPFLNPITYIWYSIMLIIVILTLLIYAAERYLPRLQLEWYTKWQTRIWQGLAALMFMYVYSRSPLAAFVTDYIFIYGSAGRGSSQFAGVGGSWSFYKVTGTIVEARKTDLFQLTREASGYIPLFWLGFFGAILALLRYPLLAAGGVFFGIGVFALEGGIRFGLYLVPILAIGSAFIALLVARYIHQIKYLNRVKFLNYGLALILVTVVAWPGFRLAYNYVPRTVAQLDQVKMLQKADQLSESTDYIISWWDYGYVMAFYANMRTILDGAKHHNDNFLVSKAFSTTSQLMAANLLRESVEEYEDKSRSGTITGSLFGPRRIEFHPHEFINSMASPDYVLARPKTRDIYLYVPYQMLPIYGVVRYFSDLNLVSGKVNRAPLITTRNYRVDTQNQRIRLPDALEVDFKRGLLLQKGQVIGQLNTLYTHQVNAQGQSTMNRNNFHSLGYYYVILSPYYGIVYVLGPQSFRSNFIQWFFFNNYDPELFEVVERNNLATLYKLKL